MSSSPSYPAPAPPVCYSRILVVLLILLRPLPFLSLLFLLLLLYGGRGQNRFGQIGGQARRSAGASLVASPRPADGRADASVSAAR
eukprot:5925585-Pyramimonas_sp.AAC.1